MLCEGSIAGALSWGVGLFHRLLGARLVRLQLLQQALAPLILLPALNAVILLPEPVPDISSCGDDDHEVIDLLAAAETERLDFGTEVGPQAAVGGLLIPNS